MPKKKKRTASLTEDELRSMSRQEIIEGMPEREVAFCEYYINDYNIKMSALKAGYNVADNKTAGKLVFGKQRVINYIAWLKLKLYDKALVKAEDILSSYAKMAFYDVTDYFDFDGENLTLKDFDKIDGQIIQEISTNQNGVISVKFPDRIKAFSKLENYMDVNPLDWRRNLEERKVKIWEDRLALEKAKVGVLEDIEDDGFIEALEKAALSINITDNDLGLQEE